MATFYELSIKNEVLRAIQDMGFEEATPIQAESIPPALEGKDVIGQAQTGTGKTVAFGIPLLDKIDPEDSHVQGFVLAPTRELAVQVSEEINRLAKYTSIRAVAVYGGQDIGRQIQALKRKPQLIVGTPGRFMDHMRRKTIRLDHIKAVVLDEADEMLSMGFIDDIETILEAVPEERHTMLFSATMPKRLQVIAEKFMKDPTVIKVKSKEMTVENIEQRFVKVHEQQKFDALCRLLDIQKPELAIIFGRTKRRVDELADALGKKEYSVEGIHGDLKQNHRDKVLRKFKEGKIDILVATDVAARGLDISGVTHVFNFDLPQDPESYVHRIGRTGRAGKNGWAVTFVTPREMPHVNNIEKTTKSKIQKTEVPSAQEASQGRRQQAVDQLLQAAGKKAIGSHQTTAEELLNEHDATTLVSAALEVLTEPQNDVNIKLTSEPPLQTKKVRGSDNRYRGDRNRNHGGRNNNYRGNRKPQGRNYKSNSKPRRSPRAGAAR